MDRLDALANEIRASAATTLAIEADGRQRSEAEGTVQRTVDESRRLDVLVNNAGVILLGPILDAPMNKWERMVQPNFLGLLYRAKAALPHLSEATEREPHRTSDIVNISSVAGRLVRMGR